MGGNEIIEVIKEEKKKGEFSYVRVMSELIGGNELSGVIQKKKKMDLTVLN